MATEGWYRPTAHKQVYYTTLQENKISPGLERPCTIEGALVKYVLYAHGAAHTTS
jgi:hypothetical protein